jgi:hypothetical protein
MWTPNSALLAAEVELLDQAQYIEIHEGGGTWALQSDVVVGAVGNASWQFTAPLVVSDLSGHVVAGKQLTIDGDGRLWLAGLQLVQPGAWLQVLGQPQKPGRLEIADSAVLVVDANGTLTASPGSLVDIYDKALFESGASWRLKAGANGFIDGGAVLKLAGADRNTLAFVDVSSNANVIFRATTRCTFEDAAVLFVGHAAQAVVEGELNFAQISRITGWATVAVGAKLAVGGGVDFDNGSTLNFLAGCTVNFAGTALLKGSPVFADALVVGQNATVLFTEGSTFKDGSIRTYNEPQIPWGPDAVQGQAAPVVGPVPPPGRTFIDVETSGLAMLETRVNLQAEVWWRLKPPSHPEVPRFLYIRQKDQTKQGQGGVGVWFVNNKIVAFGNASTAPATSAALLFWDTNTWSLVFAAGPNATLP